ncbi:Threonine/homoserine efflux transporter RhtA [Microlunatus flavus]|uniref:Threonine/homoserine efflux transporter RhtA n=1 Tax=Microlunatus flavus TaxID=1036181 RepID=A0A1H9JL81_9ACTN|nr:Threonine/homoserine efflux transporter RhtA [Microlunatus flavus]
MEDANLQRRMGLSPEHLVALATAASLLLWAAAFVVIRWVGQSLGPGALAFGRLLVGSVVLTLLVLVRHRRRPPTGRTLALVVAYGLLWFAGYAVVLNWAERHLDAGTASMLVQLAPLIVAVVAGLGLGEGFSGTLALGLVIALAGVALIAVGSHRPGVTDRIGVVLGLLAAVLYAAGVLVQKLALPHVDALTATWLGCVVGAVATSPFAHQAWTQATAASWRDVVAVVFLGVGPTAVAFTTWAYALSRSGAGRLSATTLGVPAVAIALSWLVLGEVPVLLSVVGGVLCVVGVLVTRWSRTAPGSIAPPPVPVEGSGS